jgi:hypothetical protein
VRIRSRRGSVRCGDVETTYSIVVGEGRRVRRCGCVVSIVLGRLYEVDEEVRLKQAPTGGSLSITRRLWGLFQVWSWKKEL